MGWGVLGSWRIKGPIQELTIWGCFHPSPWQSLRGLIGASSIVLFEMTGLAGETEA